MKGCLEETDSPGNKENKKALDQSWEAGVLAPLSGWGGGQKAVGHNRGHVCVDFQYIHILHKCACCGSHLLLGSS